jgi:hypothetical protein
MMPPYHLDADLLAGAVTILPPTPRRPGGRRASRGWCVRSAC